MSDVYKIRLDYRSKMTAAQWEVFCLLYSVECKTETDDAGMVRPEFSHTIEDDPLAFKRQFPNCTVEIGEAVPTTQGLEIVNALRRIEQRMDQVPAEAGLPAKPVYETDGITRAAMPEWFIAHIRTVEVRVDYCTTALQQDLDEGWHILAICPQSGQRRPDYILGRF